MTRRAARRRQTVKLVGTLVLSSDLVQWERDLLLPILLAAFQEILADAPKTNAA